jgi:hypothetical protein
MKVRWCADTDMTNALLMKILVRWCAELFMCCANIHKSLLVTFWVTVIDIRRDSWCFCDFDGFWKTFPKILSGFYWISRTRRGILGTYDVVPTQFLCKLRWISVDGVLPTAPEELWGQRQVTAKLLKTPRHFGCRWKTKSNFTGKNTVEGCCQKPFSWIPSFNR